MHDLRLACRSLARSPGFTTVALLTLALCIGANTALFSVVRSVLLRPLPYAEPDRLVHLWMDNRNSGNRADAVSWPMLNHWRDRGGSLASVAGYTTSTAFNLTGDGEPARLAGTVVTARFFETLGVPALHGRWFTDAEQTPGQDAVIILGHGFWQRRYAADPAVVGREITLNGAKRTVVGVMPPGFDFPAKTDIYLPVASSPQQMESARGNFLLGLARLKPGVSLAAAQAELAAAQPAYWERYPDFRHQGIHVAGLQDWSVRDVRTGLWVLLGAVGCVLLIGCANLANLLLVRGLGRRHEIAVHVALGASRGRLVRRVLAESVLLSLGGGALGLLLGVYGVDLIRLIAGEILPRADSIQAEPGVLAVTLIVAVLCGLVFGLAPAWQAGHVRPQEALKDGARGSSSGRGAGRLRATLVVAQAAFAFILLFGASLLLRSLWKLGEVNTGFNGEHLISIAVALPRAQYDSVPKLSAFQDQSLERLAAVPGVEATGLTTFILLNRLHSSAPVNPEGHTPAPGERIDATIDTISPGYFATMGIPLVAGRAFDRSDRPDGPLSAIINESLARARWPGRSPLGQRFLLGDPPPPGARDANGQPVQPRWFTVVGIVRDLHRDGPDRPVRRQLFLSSTQVPPLNFRFVVRTSQPAAVAAPALRAAIWTVDKNLPLPIVEPLDTMLERPTAPRRLNLWLFGSFAGLALLLASLGLYGVMAYSVGQRTGEFGVRLALGARGADLQRLVLLQGGGLALLGIILGLAGALALGRVAASLLYGVTAGDWLACLGAFTVLLLAALLACWLPARRAARVDPMTVLRSE